MTDFKLFFEQTSELDEAKKKVVSPKPTSKSPTPKTPTKKVAPKKIKKKKKKTKSKKPKATPKPTPSSTPPVTSAPPSPPTVPIPSVSHDGHDIVHAPESPGEEEPGIFSKLHSAWKDFQHGKENPDKVAGDLLGKLLPDKHNKGEGGKIDKEVPSISSPSSITSPPTTPSSTPSPSSTSPKLVPILPSTPTKPMTPPTPPSPPKPKPVTPPISKPTTVSSSPTVKTPMIKPLAPPPAYKAKQISILNTLKGDPAGQKMDIDDVEVIAYGAATGKTSQEIFDLLKKHHASSYTNTPDVMHIIGKAVGEAGGNLGDTSLLRESIKTLINESYMLEAENENDKMSETKDPKAGDMVWFIDISEFVDIFKKPNEFQDKIKFNHYRINFVDMNKPDENLVVKENVISLFYEATPITPPGTPGTHPTTPPTTSAPTTSEPKFFDEKNGTAKVMFIEGPQKGKKTIVKLLDLEFPPELIVKGIQFGYYQADINVEKASKKYENIIAKTIFNLNKGNSDLNANVNPNDIEEIKTSDIFIGILQNSQKSWRAFKNSYNNSKKPNYEDARSIIVKQKENISNAKDAKEGNSKVMHIQLVNFDDKQKIQIINNITRNVPLTKDYVLKSHKVSNDFRDVESSLVSRVNFSKGFSFWKAAGMTLAAIDGLVSGKLLSKILNGISDWLNDAGKTFGDMAGTHDISKRSNF